MHNNIMNPGHHGSAVIGSGAVEAERHFNEEIEQVADMLRAQEVAKAHRAIAPNASTTLPRRHVLLLLVAHEKRRPGGARPDVLAELEGALNRDRGAA